MKTNLFIPKRINVGYQNREDTYTKKLAYIIYFDEKGKLRKETSWNNWRDLEIANNEFDNIPMQGFILNKHVGGYKSSWDFRKSYCRVYDPRGFEFEITIDNLLYILEFVDCSSKELKGEFVYAWDSKELVLLPVDAPEYEDIKDFTNKVVNASLKDKDLIIGAEYLGKDNQKYIYLGKFDYYDRGYLYIDENGQIVSVKGEKYTSIINEDRDENKVYRNVNYGKYQFFAMRYGKDFYFETYKKLPKKIIECINTNKSEDFDTITEKLKNWEGFSPIDDSKTKLVSYSHDDFMNILKQNKKYEYDNLHHYGILSKRGFAYRLKYNKTTDTWKVSMYNRSRNYVLRESGLREGYSSDLHYKDYYGRFDIPYSYCSKSAYYTSNYNYLSKDFTDEEIFEKLEPSYVIVYLESGREFERHGYHKVKT